MLLHFSAKAGIFAFVKWELHTEGERGSLALAELCVIFQLYLYPFIESWTKNYT